MKEYIIAMTDSNKNGRFYSGDAILKFADRNCGDYVERYKDVGNVPLSDWVEMEMVDFDYTKGILYARLFFGDNEVRSMTFNLCRR